MTSEVRTVSISGRNRDLYTSLDKLEGGFTENVTKAVSFYLNKKGFLRKTSPHIWASGVEWKKFFDNMNEAEAQRFYKKFNVLDKMFRDVVDKYE